MHDLILLLCLAAFDGDRDNHPEKVRPIPLKGIAVPDDVRKELEDGVHKLGAAIDAAVIDLKGFPEMLDLLPDVRIYHKAVHVALGYNEFHDPKEFDLARGQIKEGLHRLQLLREGKPEWTWLPGPHPRGYVSKIDGSLQPYGFFIPKGYADDKKRARRMDTWFHGRMEHLSELNFIDWAGEHFDDSVRIAGGPFTPAGAFALQLYGRFCNASKFAGEMDFFEAMDDVKRRYAIDSDRIVIRGFSMGGAASWHIGTHYAGLWAAVAPGAGFAETAEFLKGFQKETLTPTDFERKLWHWYDATDYAANLSNTTTVAYSGEKDPQKQAADIMVRACAAEGMVLTHLVGPNMGHNYQPETRIELDRLVDVAVQKGRDPLPKDIRFTTWTLRYNEMKWLTVDALEQHWARARVEARFLEGAMLLQTDNVAALTIDLSNVESVRIDHDKLAPDRHFVKRDGHWKPGNPEGLVKKHGLQGPVDDAFLSSFVFVRPTGTPLNPKVGAWASSEFDHAVKHWRLQFRGDARVIDDVALTEADIANSNIVLWGDPSSNKVLAKIADKLPIHWSGKEIAVGAQKFPSDTHVPILIYPNPLNPSKYVVLNSSFTYREYDYLNNARQVPRLPDWAIVDVSTPPDTRWPGKVVTGDFFGERWELK
jgi:hypothetical protein